MENQICKKCKSECMTDSLFCPKCGNPLNEKGVKKQLGWKLVIYDFALPGLGHYKLGMKKAGLLIMGLFIIGFTLYGIESARITMDVMSSAMQNGDYSSVSNIENAIAEKSTFYTVFLSWFYLIVWIGAVVNSIRMKVMEDK